MNLTVTAALDPSLKYFRSYGDSITYGFNLPDRTSAFPYLVANYNNLTANWKDFSNPGDQACDVPTHQIFQHFEDPSISLKGLFSLMIGSNDADVKTPGPYEVTYNLCHQASIAWLADPQESKVRGSSPLVTTSGPTHYDTNNFWNAQVTDAPNASVTFPLQLSVQSPVYVWYRIIDGNPGAFSYTIDGVVRGVLTTATLTPIATQHHVTDSLALLRIPGIAPGAHVFTFTQTTDGLSGAAIVAVGAPPTRDLSARPRVLVGTIPYELDHANDSNNLPYIADQKANVALLAGDGLDVELYDSRTYMTGSTADMIDPRHPNALGHQEIFKALEDTLK